MIYLFAEVKIMNIFRIKLVWITAIIFLLAGVFITPAVSEQQVKDLLRQKQPVETLLKLVQRFENEFQIREALQFYEQVLEDEPDNHDILLKAAYLHYRLGWLYVGKIERKDHYFKFFDYANRAKQINPQDYHTSLLLIGAKAKKAGYLSNGDQVRIARELERDIQALMDRKSNDPDTIYLLSWLNFKVGRVSALEKILAAILFGGLPKDMSVEKSFALMEKAIQLRPDYIVYQYDLGLFYQRTGNKLKARAQFEKVLSMQPHTSEGTIYQRRVHARMREINGVVR